jgi:hypothetical protein
MGETGSHEDSRRELPEDSEAMVTAALRNLEAACPHYYIWTDRSLLGCRIWFAQGRDGHPWLVMSDDFSRFRAALTR